MRLLQWSIQSTGTRLQAKLVEQEACDGQSQSVYELRLMISAVRQYRVLVVDITHKYRNRFLRSLTRITRSQLVAWLEPRGWGAERNQRFGSRTEGPFKI